MRHKQVLHMVLVTLRCVLPEWVNWQTFQGFRSGQHLKEIAPLFLQIVGQARACRSLSSIFVVCPQFALFFDLFERLSWEATQEDVSMDGDNEKDHEARNKAVRPRYSSMVTSIKDFWNMIFSRLLRTAWMPLSALSSAVPKRCRFGLRGCTWRLSNYII